jgi:hypothetical protein
MTLAEEFLVSNDGNYIEAAMASDVCSAFKRDDGAYDLSFADGSRLKSVTEDSHNGYVSYAEEFLVLLKEESMQGKDYLEAAVEFGATEVVDMLLPDSDGDNYHNVHFPDGSALTNVSKNEHLGHKSIMGA